MLPYVLIVIYLALVLLRPQDYPGWSGPPVLTIALVAAFVTWLFSRDKRFDAPQYVLLLLFTLATCMSLVVSGWPGGAYAQLIAFYPTLVGFTVLANVATTQARTLFVMKVFALSAAVLAIHGIQISLTGTGWTGMTGILGTSRIQYVGIFSDPNDLGLLFVACVPMSVFLALRGGLGLRTLFWGTVLVLLLYGILLTDSRGSMLAVIAMVGAYIFLKRGPMTAGLLAGGAFLVLQLLPSRLNELEVQEASAMDRVYAWYHGIEMFLSSPLFGVGTGRFVEYHHLTAHNSLILVLSENGFIGLVLWLAFIGYCFWMMMRVLAAAPDIEDEETLEVFVLDRSIALTLLISLVGFFSCAFFLSRSYNILLYLIAAFVVAHFSGVRDRFPVIQGFPVRQGILLWPAVGALAVVGFYVVVKVLLAMA